MFKYFYRKLANVLSYLYNALSFSRLNIIHSARGFSCRWKCMHLDALHVYNAALRIRKVIRQDYTLLRWSFSFGAGDEGVSGAWNGDFGKDRSATTATPFASDPGRVVAFFIPNFFPKSLFAAHHKRQDSSVNNWYGRLRCRSWAFPEIGNPFLGIAEISQVQYPFSGIVTWPPRKGKRSL